MSDTTTIPAGSEIKLLPVRLTDQERNDYARALAEEVKNLDDAEENKKEVTKTLGDAIKAQKLVVNALTRKVTNGVEYREISCTILRDLRNRVILTERDDTMEIIDRRPMTRAEVAEFAQPRFEDLDYYEAQEEAKKE